MLHIIISKKEKLFNIKTNLVRRFIYIRYTKETLLLQLINLLQDITFIPNSKYQKECLQQLLLQYQVYYILPLLLFLSYLSILNAQYLA